MADAEEPPPEVPGYGTRGFYGDSLDDEKGRSSFIKEVTSQVRRAPEMLRYRTFLGENLDLGGCAILTGLTADDAAAAPAELHHHPMTLYDVVELVLGQMEHDGDRLTTMSVAGRVSAYHWRAMVGLVPLTQSLHEMAHSGQLKIDPRMIFGNWQGLLDECRDGITQHLADKLRAEASSWNSEGRAGNRRLLEVIPQRWAARPPTAANLLSGPVEGGEDD